MTKVNSDIDTSNYQSIQVLDDGHRILISSPHEYKDFIQTYIMPKLAGYEPPETDTDEGKKTKEEEVFSVKVECPDCGSTMTFLSKDKPSASTAPQFNFGSSSASSESSET